MFKLCRRYVDIKRLRTAALWHISDRESEEEEEEEDKGGIFSHAPSHLKSDPGF